MPTTSGCMIPDPIPLRSGDRSTKSKWLWHVLDLGSVGHRPADLFIFSKGLERASAQAFFSYIKGWARRAQAHKEN